MNEPRPSSVLRLLDANANRAAEGLRTIEDIARLVREDRALAESIKSLRHNLAAVTGRLARLERLAARSAETDAGTTVTTDAEAVRRDWQGIVSAAAERTTQSLRCLEEFSKFISPQLSHDFKQLRYEAYDVLAEVEIKLQNHATPLAGHIYLLIDCSLSLDGFPTYLRELADAGVDYVQLRDKSAETGQLMQYAKVAVACLADSPARFFVNDRLDIALASGAAGVHLGQEDMALPDARRIADGRLLIGISTHNLDQALEAEASGADYIGCGPTFPSNTKQFESFPGVAYLHDVHQRIHIPAFAIGGINLDNVHSVVATGCKRIAVSHAIHQAPDPAEATRELRAALTREQPTPSRSN